MQLHQFLRASHFLLVISIFIFFYYSEKPIKSLFLVKEGKFLRKYTPQRMFHHSKLSTSLNRLKSKELQAKSTLY